MAFDLQKLKTRILSIRGADRKWIPILAPAFAALLVGVLVVLQPPRGPESVRSMEAPRYLVALRDLRPGEILSLEDLRYTNDDFPDSGLATDQQLDLVLGSQVLTPISVDEPIPFSAIERSARTQKKKVSLPAGHRAFPIEVERILGVAAGDRVDVFGPTGEAAPEFPRLVEGALVVKSEGEQLVIAVPPSAVALLQKSSAQGKLRVALCSREDGDRPVQVRRKRKHSHRKTIHIWSEEA